MGYAETGDYSKLSKKELRANQARCKKCIHSSNFGIYTSMCTCSYILDEGHSRGCPPGVWCKEFVERTKDTALVRPKNI